MINNKLAKSLIALSVLSLVSGTALSVNAATDNSATTSSVVRAGLRKNMRVNLIKNKLGDGQKVSLDAKMVQRQKDMTAKRVAVDTALTNSDYQSWITAVGSTSEVAKKITADNFPKLVQAYNLKKQADAIMKDLGVEQMMFGGRVNSGLNK